MAIRLQRYLAQAGIASRRKCEDLIAAGLVAVNGEIVTRAGTTVEPERDEVTYRGRKIEPLLRSRGAGSTRVMLLNKPRGVLTTRSDRRGRRTVYDLIAEPAGVRLIYVGRLDRDTEGALLFTTNGDLAHRLTHPRWAVERVYEAEVRGRLDEERLAMGAQKGVMLSDGRTGRFQAEVAARRGSGEKARRRVELRLAEGRKREVRRIIRACGGSVERLTRKRFAFLTLEGLEVGGFRWLDDREVRQLCAIVDLVREGEEEGMSARREA